MDEDRKNLFTCFNIKQTLKVLFWTKTQLLSLLQKEGREEESPSQVLMFPHGSVCSALSPLVPFSCQPWQLFQASSSANFAFPNALCYAASARKAQRSTDTKLWTKWTENVEKSCQWLRKKRKRKVNWISVIGKEKRRKNEVKMPTSSLPPLLQCSCPDRLPERASQEQVETKPSWERENYSETAQVLTKQTPNKSFLEKHHFWGYILRTCRWGVSSHWAAAFRIRGMRYSGYEIFRTLLSLWIWPPSAQEPKV